MSWGIEFHNMHKNKFIAYLWIDENDVKYEGYVIIEPEKYLEWKKKAEEDKEIPKYYEECDYIIGESSLEEDIWNAGWGLDTGLRKIFINPNNDKLIPLLIKDIVERGFEEWILAWALYLMEKAESWKKEIRTIKTRRIGNSLIISVHGLEEGKKYNRLRTKDYDNLLIIYKPLNIP